MKAFKICSVTGMALMLALALPACKTKKAVVQTPAPVKQKPDMKAEAAQPKFPATPMPPPEVAPAPEPVDYRFINIQFEFDSPILKTSSYPAMDKVAREIKKNTSVKFMLNGYSSAEGTPAHNLSLSEERANAVKAYLTNSGVDAAQLIVKGYGESNPLNNNKTENEKALNRRVEIKKAK